MNVIFHTLGCKVNQYETEVMTEHLKSHGFDTSQKSHADIVVINSCTVTGESDHKVRKLVRRCRREHPQSVIVLTGCYPQTMPDIDTIVPEADIILGTKNRAHLANCIFEYLHNGRRIIWIDSHQTGDAFESMAISGFTNRTRAFVKIEDGCNRFCSYCIIPHARGRVRSKPIELLKEELTSLASAGYREVVLVGINLSAYGEDLGLTLYDAVKAACMTDGLVQVRLGSLEPDMMDISLIKRLSKLPKLCPHFHLSLQSGCNTTLKNMNRHYTTHDFEVVTQNLRLVFPHCSITTDIMVGFPEESNEDFNASLQFCKKIAFSDTHIFVYSPRPGTPAASRVQIDKSIKSARSKTMIAAANVSRQRFLQSQIGRIYTVIFEQSIGQNLWEGYTNNYIPVKVISEKPLSHISAAVKIMTTDNHHCIGHIVE